MTKLIVRLAGIVVATALLTAVPAQAAPLVSEVEAGYTAALTWWGAPAAPGCSSVTFSVEPTDPYREHAAARATQPEPGEVVACTVTVYEDAWADESLCMRTMTLRHEAGHTLGFGHSPDAESIMVGGGIDVDVWCPHDRDAMPGELIAQRARCRAMPQQGPQAVRCWRWARQLRGEIRSDAARS